ncbi:pheA operon leader peptide PheL [Escherichia coli]
MKHIPFFFAFFFIFP